VLAYVFWHRPREGASVPEYEQALGAFQRSLARTPPAGLVGSVVHRVGAVPWSVGAELGCEHDGVTMLAGYEDWYLVEDYAALGVLAEAAVGHGHRTSHDRAARELGWGTASLYRLLEGDARSVVDGAVSHAIWVGRPPGSRERPLAELLGDGMDPEHASLWQRQLALGPAPEFCLLSGERPQGVGPARLPQGWSAYTVEREHVEAS
jgi:hypothetical protein